MTLWCEPKCGDGSFTVNFGVCVCVCYHPKAANRDIASFQWNAEIFRFINRHISFQHSPAIVTQLVVALSLTTHTQKNVETNESK